MKNPLIVIAGATATGKSNISIELAKKINAEIISADSMQVYKHMDIGTAKISIEEQKNIKHHLIDILEPNERFSVAKFQYLAKNAIEEIYAKNKIPIIVGGTGFYINSVLYNTDFEKEDENNEYINELESIALKYGNEYLHKMLAEIDEISATNIHFNNRKRVIRALDYYKKTGNLISTHNINEKEKEIYYNCALFILDNNREILYNRINQRVDKMVNDGLIEEVESLVNLGYKDDLNAMNGIGYKEIIKYLNSQCTKEESIELIKKNSRNFAKRQNTWFKHQNNGVWLNTQERNTDEIISEIIEVLSVKKIL